MKDRIFLIGFMGVGKSTVGKKIARELGFGFIDTDKVFENKYRININMFFDKYDEELFRKLEHEILEETLHLEQVVISTGGGTPCYFGAMEKMNAGGLTIYLEMSEKSLLQRLRNARRKRPLVTNLTDDELNETISNKLEERRPYYSQAQIVYPAQDIDISDLVRKIRNF